MDARYIEVFFCGHEAEKNNFSWPGEHGVIRWRPMKVTMKKWRPRKTGRDIFKVVDQEQKLILTQQLEINYIRSFDNGSGIAVIHK